VIAYASRTGTRSTLAALREAGWRLLVSAAGELRTEGFQYALDNGAWSAYQRGDRFDESAFLLALNKLGRDADFVVLPDIVSGGEQSLDLTFRWMQRVYRATERVLISVQDGHEPWQIDELLGPRVGVFVGGSTGWKLATTPRWAAVARAKSSWCHVGRVNTKRRIALCGAAGALSFDGTSVVQYPSTIDRLDRATRRATLQGGLAFDDGLVPDDQHPCCVESPAQLARYREYMASRKS
jgi:hypothetical protein